jgi:hypothetical protein
VITAFASSYLGTAGTITGAALASVVGTVSTSVLRTSADRSAERLRQTTARIRETRSGAMPTPTDTHPVETGTTGEADRPGSHLLGAPDPDPTAGRTRTLSRPRWVMLGVGAVIAFAVALVAITGIESAAGKPLAGLVGKESGGGTTLGRATGTDTGNRAPDPTPTTTPTTTPTSGAPSPSPTQNPSGSPTSGPTPTPSATTAPTTPPTPAPSGSPNPLTSETP